MMQFGDERLPKRFWDKVSPEPMSGCWLWIGACNRDGYGHLWMGKLIGSHRLSFSAENEIPAGLVIDHKCRVRCCVNPAHLRAVTQGRNVLCGISPSALHAKQTTCLRGHDLVGENLYVFPDGERCCRTCKRLRDRIRSSRTAADRRAARSSEPPVEAS